MGASFAHITGKNAFIKDDARSSRSEDIPISPFKAF